MTVDDLRDKKKNRTKTGREKFIWIKTQESQKTDKRKSGVIEEVVSGRRARSRTGTRWGRSVENIVQQPVGEVHGAWEIGSGTARGREMWMGGKEGGFRWGRLR